MNHKSVKASNVKLLGTGKDRSDHAHVKRVTPFDTKRKEMKASSELGLDPKRVKHTTRLRRDKDVKPL